MNTKDRRNAIYNMLESSGETITAMDFAEKFGVTRQIIVGDIAILRANGAKILSSKTGYSIPVQVQTGIIETIACSHDKARTREELYTIVDNGATIINVTIEHPVYGQITGELELRSRYDVDQYLSRMEETGASQLSELTGGAHIHALSMPDYATFNRIVNILTESGIIVSQDIEE